MSQRLQKNELSSEDLTKYCINQIEKSKKLNAFTSVSPTPQLLQDAKQADQRRMQGFILLKLSLLSSLHLFISSSPISNFDPIEKSLAYAKPDQYLHLYLIFNI